MRKKLLSILISLLILCLGISSLTACGSTPPASSGVKKISSQLLNGKIANFLGAQGLGVVDKGTIPATFSARPTAFDAVAYEQEEEIVQKKTELVKKTDCGNQDVHFYQSSQEITGYKDLNKQFAVHHHNGEECTMFECDEISDEIEQQESEGIIETVISLDARVNKLYNHGNFTFMSVSSAVEGNLRVYVEKNKAGMFLPIDNVNVLVNPGTGGDAVDRGVAYILIPAQGETSPSAIPIKQYENDTDFHKSNYWSNDYNQSYVIDNRTGKTYSLSQFPYIYSVENGLIKVYNETANGKFDYYNIEINQNQISFTKIELPTAEQFSIGYAPYSNTVLVDKFGHMLIKNNNLSNDQTLNQYGEKTFANNVICCAPTQIVYEQISQQYRNEPNIANLFQRRYLNAQRYHKGSDDRIYRLDFKGNLSDIKVDVLTENGSWQPVENSVDVTFEGSNGFILYNYSLMFSLLNNFWITKISNGYAYYSTAASTDGGRVWEGNVLLGEQDVSYGEYVGVVKIPVSGPIQSQMNNIPYQHLEYLAEWFVLNINLHSPYKVFLVGDTQMLCLLGSDNYSGIVCLTDVTTGQTKKLGSGTLRDLGYKNSIYIEEYGWLNLSKEVDFETFNEHSFTPERQEENSDFDAYFKFVVELTNK